MKAALRIQPFADRRTDDQAAHDLALRMEAEGLAVEKLFRQRVAENIRRRIADGRYSHMRVAA
jgi:hypothetical protein